MITSTVLALGVVFATMIPELVIPAVTGVILTAQPGRHSGCRLAYARSHQLPDDISNAYFGVL
jgi:hypothetical protein